MSENRVIGQGNKIPWHLPEDFKWFKQVTTGHVIVMGRKTFESIGKPLPNRTTVVITRSQFSFPGVKTISDLQALDELHKKYPDQEIFICGGAQIYEQTLLQCTELLLTTVKRTVEGDAFFPPFENLFRLEQTIAETPDFRIQRFRRRF